MQWQMGWVLDPIHEYSVPIRTSMNDIPIYEAVAV